MKDNYNFFDALTLEGVMGDLDSSMSKEQQERIDKALGRLENEKLEIIEEVNVYNRKREITDVIKERNKLDEGEYRISVHIWFINKSNELLIQQRVSTAKRFPNMWSQTGGGALANESSKETVKRESKEELNLEIDENEIYYVGSYIRKKDIVDVWLVKKEIDIDKLELEHSEVANVKLVTFKEFDNMIEEGIVVPSINPSYLLIKNYYENYNE